MRLLVLLEIGSSLTIAAARNIAHDVQQVLPALGEATERYLIELAPEETRWIVEDDKWALRRVGKI